MVEFKKISGFSKVTLYNLLVDAYSFDVYCKKIIVTTNGITLPIQINYKSIGFIKLSERINNEIPFSGNYIDYEMVLKK